MSAESETTAELLAGLGAQDREVQRRACDEATAAVRSDPELRDAVRQLLRRPEPRARFGAAFTLFRAEGPSLALLSPLLESLELPDGDQRWEAAQMLVTLGRLQGEVFPVLAHTTREATSPVRRRMALYALRELAPEHVETERALLAAVDDVEPEVRRAGLSSLAKLHEPGAACFDKVRAVLEGDPDPRMQRIAAVLLPGLAEHHAEQAGEARATLERLAAGDDGELARAATLALSRMDAAR